MQYRDRIAREHSDGTPVFASEADRQSEVEVANLVGAAWRCQLRQFAMLAPLDWYVVRDERVVGVAELKTRTHSSEKFSTVFLNVRKWLAMRLAEVGLGCPAVFIVRFLDGVWWIRLDDIDASRIRMGGCAARVKSDSDIEPVIEVPITAMKPLTTPPPEAKDEATL